MGEVGRYLTYEITTTSHPRMIGEEREKHVEDQSHLECCAKGSQNRPGGDHNYSIC
jgi:hypothetical protein